MVTWVDHVNCSTNASHNFINEVMNLSVQMMNDERSLHEHELDVHGVNAL